MMSEISCRVLVTGACPDNHNRNTVLRDYVAEGFGQVDAVGAVATCPLERAADVAALFSPDVVLCFGSCMPDDADYAQLRRWCSEAGACLVFWLHDDPYEFDYNYKLDGVADIVFSNDRWCAAHYAHPWARHLPLAASKAAHWRDSQATKNINLFFCGVAFDNRKRLLKDLRGTLERHDALILGDGWPKDLPFCENRRLGNSELSDHYARAALTLNMGRDFHYANDRFKLDPSTPGPRTFEAAMAGAAQLFFVESLEIIDYYDPAKEIVLYNSGHEFSRLVDDLLASPEECGRIGQAAQTRTIRDHTYAVRAGTIIDEVERWRQRA